MKKLITLTACFAIAACAAPAEEEGGTGPDAATVNTANDDTVGDAGDPPSMETVAAAIGETCVGFSTNLRSATCEATELGQSFACEFALESDDEGVTRALSMTQTDGAWAVEDEPKFCDTLSRANAMAGEPADANVPTQPTE